MMMLMIAATLAPSAPYDRCIAAIDRGAFVKTQTLDCATKDMDRADAALNARYREVMLRLSSQRRAQLRLERSRLTFQWRAMGYPSIAVGGANT